MSISSHYSPRVPEWSNNGQSTEGDEKTYEPPSDSNTDISPLREAPKKLGGTTMQERLASVDQLPENSVINRLEDFVELQPDPNHKGSYFLNENNPFCARFGRNKKQIIWLSNAPVTSMHVKEIVAFSKKVHRFLHINTGTHGDASGNTVVNNAVLAEALFSKEDLETAWQSGSVSIHIVSRKGPPLRPKIDYVDAWCYSEKSRDGASKIIEFFDDLLSSLGIRDVKLDKTIFGMFKPKPWGHGLQAIAGRDIVYACGSVLGYSRLCVAATQGWENDVKRFIEQGDDINLVNVDENTPLDDAIREGHISIEKILRERKAKKSIELQFFR